VRAQQADTAADDQRLTAELVGPINRWEKTNDQEEKINALETALRAESQIKQWALTGRRPDTKGRLFHLVGYSYQTRLPGDRADNLEKAIAVRTGTGRGRGAGFDR
jgi:hypothetical protein